MHGRSTTCQRGNSASICLTKKFKFDIGIRSHTVCRIVDSVRAKKTNESRVATPPGQRRKDRSLVTKMKLILKMNTLMMDVCMPTVPCYFGGTVCLDF